jgi:hypothetical protein
MRKANNKKVRWDEPKGATTPRGWCYIDGLSQTWDGHKPVGFYLTYRNEISDGKPVFAKAYVYRDLPGGCIGTGAEQCRDFATVQAAKRWVERIAPTLA